MAPAKAVDVQAGRVRLTTAVWAALAIYVAAVYVGVVLGGALVAGDLVGDARRSDPGDVALSVVATVLVAATFERVRAALRGLLRRTRRFGVDDPYEVLTAFAASVATAQDSREVMARTARVVGEATGALEVSVWLTVDRAPRQVGHWSLGSPVPEAGPAAPATPTAGSAPATHREFPVRHASETLGSVSLRLAAGATISPVEDRLVAHLAVQAGVALRNAQLGEELTARLGDLSSQAHALRESRQRIVAVQDAERRRLERDIHDGAQQHLVALAVRLRLAKLVLAKDPHRAAGLVAAMQPAVAQARETVTELARGVYPPQLSAHGLPAALTAQAAAAPLPVVVDAAGLGRFGLEAEAVVYFCVLEALQNAVKHAGATQVTITLTGTDDQLSFTVTDDGHGFDPGRVAAGKVAAGKGLSNLADRVEAVGGVLEIISSPAGTLVRAQLPAQARTAEPA